MSDVFEWIHKGYFYTMSVLVTGLILNLIWKKIEDGKIPKEIWRGSIIALLIILAPAPFLSGTFNINSLLQRANDFTQTVTQKFTEMVSEIQDEKSEPVQKVTVEKEQNSALTRALPSSPYQDEIPDSWDEIIAAIDDGTAQRRYAVGAYKPLDLGQFGTVNMQLAGFNLDDRADGQGKAATTWLAKEILSETHRWNPEQDNNKEGTGAIGGWGKCELRRWMNERVLSAIPKDVRDRLISVKKSQKCYDTNWNWIQQTTEDSVWIPSYDEVFGDQSLYYGLFRNQSDRRVKTRNGSAAWWWLRSAGNDVSANLVGNDGSISGHGVNNTSGGVVLGFCL
ncbi:MAG: DUF6273 domain-containing protein [bacterium]